MKDVGENGYIYYVGKDDDRKAIFAKNDQLFKEKDHLSLVKMSKKEKDRFAKRKVKFQIF